MLLSTVGYITIGAHEVRCINLFENFFGLDGCFAVVVHVYFVGISRKVFHLHFVLCNHFLISPGSFYLIHVVAVRIGYLEVLLVIFELLFFFVISLSPVMINTVLSYHSNKLDFPILKWVYRWCSLLRLWILVGLGVVCTLGLLTISSATRRWFYTR